MNSEKQELEGIINKALKELYEKDKYLILNKPDNQEEYHVSERGIVFRFVIYLNNIMSQIEHLKDYHIDTEYNRNLNMVKSTHSRPNGLYPDLIIHIRESHNNNLLVIEFKTWWNKGIREDVVKIKELMEEPFNYKYGLIVILNKIYPPTLKWIQVRYYE